MTLRPFITALFVPVMVACVDSNYDLSDVDTTIRVDARDLVIPVNIDPISMESIITINPGDAIEVFDGQYAVVRDGEFDSDPILIPSIHLPSPAISPTENVITVIPPSRAISGSVSYNIATTASDFTFSSSFVSPFIVSISEIGCNVSFSMRFAIIGLDNYIDRLSLSGLVIQMPKGLRLTNDAGGTYDPLTGELSIPDRIMTPGSLQISVTASSIDFAQAGGVYDYDQSAISLTGSLFIKKGIVEVDLADLKPGISTLPQSMTLRTDYTLSDMDITTFSGRVKYTLDITDLTDIDLSDLPDVLAQESTNISLANPMLFLQIFNPLQQYSLFARTGLDIAAFHGSQVSHYSLDNSYFQIGPDNADSYYNFCLSPQEPTVAVPEFPAPAHVPFTSLSHVLSGKGIPGRLAISLVEPSMPEQSVSGLRLGSDLGRLSGKYKLVAPLSFLDGSTVTYTHTVDGWGSEDLDDLTVTALDVNLDISTDVPVEVEFSGYPIDKNGKPIPGVTIESTVIPAAAKNHPVTLHVTGEFSHLDGITFTAVATADGSEIGADTVVVGEVTEDFGS